MTPAWLKVLAVVSLIFAGGCAAAIAVDIARGRRRRMWIMNVVWPVTTLWSGPHGLWAYLQFGRAPRPSGENKPLPQVVATAETHCGAGCTLGDSGAE